MKNSKHITTSKYDDSQYDNVIEFLGELYRLDPEHPYWLPGRWEYAAYLVSPLYLSRGKPDWRKTIRLWKDEKNIVGIIHSENPNENYYIHLHPEYEYIREEMIEWAEKSTPFKKIQIWLNEEDSSSEKILNNRGFTLLDKSYDYLNWRDLSKYEPSIEIPDKYSFCSLVDDTYLESKIDCAAKAFNSKKVPKSVYKFMQTAPSYKRAYDFFILYKEKVVSLCIVWLDKENNLGYIEPVATHPEFQRQGLGKAILNYAMKQLKEDQISYAYVGASGNDRKSFYFKAGFTKSVALRPWKKNLRKNL
ncbi:GNAT family N-acetyltransferase [Candidatus Dojkabacteria bacterium]|nr:GNAT family N-acetyltransferase [Candidatus Dojkabacteria bacterium]